MHQRQSLALNLLDHHAQNLLLRLLVFRQKDQSCTILALFRHRDSLKQNKLVGYLYHDTRTVTGLVACLGATVFHVLKHLQCIVNQFMTLATMNIHHHAHAAGIMFILTLVESFSFASFHIILYKNFSYYLNRAQNYIKT